MKITRKITNEIIFEDDSNMIKDCIINAIKNDASLRGADLREADLHGAYLRGAYLRGADLRCAYLRGADLSEADLSEADLRDADLSCADLSKADLREADLRDANLRGADLRCANNIPFISLSCPSDGEFIGWKKVSTKLVKLLITADARRSSAMSNKCRCDKAKVLEITDLDGNNPITSVTNYCNYEKTQYVVGKMVYPDSFDKNRWNECSHGIHFFINKQEAINY